MAMLAEPRRKVRYTVNPTGKDWRQNGDSSQFGQRMLHSMGWQEGLGLGKDCQGAVEPIRVRRKNDQRGVGCSGAYAAESMQQTDEFANLLSQLNAEHNGASEGNNDTSSGAVSLEAKSRASKARLHYHRFTRGKDVSAYGSKALACIFGTRTSQTAKTDAVNDADQDIKEEKERDGVFDSAPAVGLGFGGAKSLSHSNSESCLTGSSNPEPISNGLHLVQSQTSLQDYFRVKMLQRQMKQQQQQPLVETQPEPVADQSESQSSWTSESSCSAASTLLSDAEPSNQSRSESCQPKSAKRVCFSLSPAPVESSSAADRVNIKVQDNDSSSFCDNEVSDDGMTVIDFFQFPGSEMQRILGYVYY